MMKRQNIDLLYNIPQHLSEQLESPAKNTHFSLLVCRRKFWIHARIQTVLSILVDEEREDPNTTEMEFRYRMLAWLFVQ